MNAVTVVIVEDNRQWLSRLSADVAGVPGLCLAGTADTPEVAMRMTREVRPHIMILDLFLAGGGSGVDVLRFLREHHLDTRVIAVTGAPTAELRAACLELGARYFLDKAFDFDQIQPALQILADEAARSAP